MMFNWFKSFRGAITLSVISLLIFLGRTFIDFYFVYGEFSLDIAMIGITILIHMVLFGGWIWGLLSAVKGSRRGIITVFGFNLFFFLFIAVGTLVSYCPSPCETGWPLGEIGSWSSFVAGLLAAFSLGIQVWGRSAHETSDFSQTEAI